MGNDLQTLFERWRRFERVARDASGTPDYGAAAMQADAFRLSDFFAGLNAIGILPASLVRWELTGQHDGLFAAEPTRSHSDTACTHS